jgi:hypothetical protein
MTSEPKKRGRPVKLYKAEDYLEGGQYYGTEKNDAFRLLTHYAAQAFLLHNKQTVFTLDEIKKRTPSANSIISLLGGLDEAKKYIDYILADNDGYITDNAYAIGLVFRIPAVEDFLNRRLQDNRPKHLRKLTKGIVEDRTATRGKRF